MAKRTKNLKDLEAAEWVISPRMRAYCADKYPDLDVDSTYELFCDKALANDWVYANWDAAFREYLRKPREWGGFAYQSGLDDPKWRQLIIEADALGFRRPHLPAETPEQYRQALRAYQPPSQPNLMNLGDNLKRVPK